MLLININGTESEIAASSTLQDLIRIRELPEARLVLELNGEIIKREHWGSVKLSPGDKLEVIQVLGGG